MCAHVHTPVTEQEEIPVTALLPGPLQRARPGAPALAGQAQELLPGRAVLGSPGAAALWAV